MSRVTELAEQGESLGLTLRFKTIVARQGWAGPVVWRRQECEILRSDQSDEKFTAKVEP